MTRKIERGDDKASKVTAFGSQLMSEINEGYDECPMCIPKDEIIADLKEEIEKFER